MLTLPDMKLISLPLARTFCLALLLSGSATFAAASEAPYSLPKLPYPVDALVPVISPESLAIHHGETHKGYLNALNRAVENDPKMEGVTLSALLAHASKLDGVVRASAGGHYNHSFFWTIMAPVGTGGTPSSTLLKRVETDFGSLEKMQSAIEAAGETRKESGWVWLVWTGTKLAVTTTRNEDNPLMDDVEIQGSPIIAIDLWEHAYFLTYQAKRAEYLHAWWTVANWKEINSRYALASTDPK